MNATENNLIDLTDTQLDIFYTTAVLRKNGMQSRLIVKFKGIDYGYVPLWPAATIEVRNRNYFFRSAGDLYPNTISAYLDHPDTNFELGIFAEGIGTADIRDLRESRSVISLHFNLEGSPPKGTRLILALAPAKPSQGLTFSWEENYFPY